MKTLSGIPMGEALAAPEQVKPAEIAHIRDRRRSLDRRQGERRQEDRDRKRKRVAIMRSLFLILAGVILIQVTLEMVDAQNKRADALRPTPPMIQVRIAGAGVWKSKPKDLAFYFASQDIMATQEKRGPLKEKIRNDQLDLRVQSFLKNGDSQERLLGRVREMPWNEYRQRAEFESDGEAERKPTESDWQLALRDAVIE